jgi:hypothetical protein
MSLKDALAAEKATATKGPPCGMAVILARLTPEDSAALQAYLADQQITTTIILRALTTEGHKVGQNTVQRHRRGICACPRP